MSFHCPFSALQGFSVYWINDLCRQWRCSIYTSSEEGKGSRKELFLIVYLFQYPSKLFKSSQERCIKAIGAHLFFMGLGASTVPTIKRICCTHLAVAKATQMQHLFLFLPYGWSPELSIGSHRLPGLSHPVENMPLFPLGSSTRPRHILFHANIHQGV